jgi:glycosyltransferase involved in cell wall biosynthesis
MPITQSHDKLPPSPGKQHWPWVVSSKAPHVNHSAQWPRITIVTPSLNQGPFIEETIRSVLLQGYPNVEYMIVDGGSTDNTLEIIDRYASFLHYTVSEPDDGQAHAINKGFSHSSGQIMGWLNSDDILEPGALFHIAEAFKHNDDLLVVTGFRRVYNKKGDFVANWIRDLPTNYYLTHYCCVAQETTYWNRKIWDELGPLDEQMQYAMDYEYWHRILAAGYHFRLIPHYVGGFRDHPENKTSTMRATFEKEASIIYQRYNIALNEEEALSELGADWWSKHNLIKDLCTNTKIANSPRQMMILLRLLEKQPFQYMAVQLYRYYRNQNVKPSIHRALFDLLKAISLPHPRKRMANVISDFPQPVDAIPFYKDAQLSIQVLHDETVLNECTNITPDGLVFGRGWHSLENDTDGMSFRWATERAQIIVTRPTHEQRRLRLDIETGPSLKNRPFELCVIDSSGQLVSSKTITERKTDNLLLPLTPGQSQFFFLQLDENSIKNASTIPSDGRRFLYYRILQLGWDDLLASKLELHFNSWNDIRLHQRHWPIIKLIILSTIRLRNLGRLAGAESELLSTMTKQHNHNNSQLCQLFDEYEQIRLAEHRSVLARTPIIGFLARTFIRIKNLGKLEEARMRLYKALIEQHNIIETEE